MYVELYLSGPANKEGAYERRFYFPPFSVNSIQSE